VIAGALGRHAVGLGEDVDELRQLHRGGAGWTSWRSLIPGCQGCQAPDVQGLGYGARSRRPSSPVRLYPSTAGLGFKEEIG
jgi:hypothetical protein